VLCAVPGLFWCAGWRRSHLMCFDVSAHLPGHVYKRKHAGCTIGHRFSSPPHIMFKRNSSDDGLLALAGVCTAVWRFDGFGGIPSPNLTTFSPKKISRSEELPGNSRRQRSILCCSWVVLVCRMATIPPDVFLTLSAHPLDLYESV
jgi:hypothetical protein